MPEQSRREYSSPPLNLCELLLRDVASLILMSQQISHTLPSLRPKCEFSDELTRTLDDMLAISSTGKQRLHPPLLEAGAVLPESVDAPTCALVTGYFTRLPEAQNTGVLAAEIMANLRLLAQHVELKARLAAEAAVLVGQSSLSQALVACSADWRNCGLTLRASTVRARALAYVADLTKQPGTTEN